MICPTFQDMLKDISNTQIKAIAFYKLDIISRNVTDFSNLITKLDNFCVSFLSATENIEDWVTEIQVPIKKN